MKNLLILCILFMAFSACGQDLNCSDFKNGEFLVPADSIYPISSKIKRKNGRQIEWSEKGDSIYGKIKYIDDCNYILTYDSKLNVLDKFEQYINDSGGMQIKVLRIKGDTLFYNGILKNDTLLFEQPSLIIKLK